MLFNSYDFWVFFGVVYLCYLLLPRLRLQNLLLLAASYYFYAAWDWRFLSLILISTATDYLCGLGIHHARAPGRRKLLLTLSVVVNLGLLGFFKYFGFFVESLDVLLDHLGLPTSQLRLGVILPVGISFYTFQTMSYTIDIYRRQMTPTRDFFNFALFVAFFPQLVAG
ncbi:MAG: MBOAT family protein, partial [Candidatus Krumholzibacteriota bacterium]|nr:MBOAT family protein [Candidatus Krumholzibacteriota bacterium]